MTDQEFMMKYYGDIIEELRSLTGVVNWMKSMKTGNKELTPKQQELVDNLTKKTLEQLEKVRAKLHKRDEDIKKYMAKQLEILEKINGLNDEFDDVYDEGA